MRFYTKEVLKDIPSNVTVVAATKYFGPKEMLELFETGITNFGENRVEALLEKQEALKDMPITWHFIGTLQTKKVRKMIDAIDFLHSLNTFKLAEEINKRRTSPLKCFIQVNISSEISKHGFEKDEIIPFLESIKHFTNIKVIGLMGMAELTENEDIISQEFQVLNDIQKEIRETLNIDLKDLSIGMSNDYLIAIKHNGTYLRLGSVLFKKEVS
ncbi:hypothetical protein KQ51_01264 [Candidatus Izimaplasma bacterium HR1]|jgi:pyridoxal phosphate enzyme (YggS family)|uniref:YggS family pyridoxal phosphate-dependent enzyme n=1 Tax=Candidatus Izimoplasma sp. HR1 TaxID=1541959 RepID=UPI0004F8F2A8|nr:hypothetical protein KQ51_01264 [Candidatus Izimaplasma bacterium HR1]